MGGNETSDEMKLYRYMGYWMIFTHSILRVEIKTTKSRAILWKQYCVTHNNRNSGNTTNSTVSSGSECLITYNTILSMVGSFWILYWLLLVHIHHKVIVISVSALVHYLLSSMGDLQCRVTWTCFFWKMKTVKWKQVNFVKSILQWVIIFPKVSLSLGFTSLTRWVGQDWEVYRSLSVYLVGVVVQIQIPFFFLTYVLYF